MADEGRFIMYEGKKYARISTILDDYADFSKVPPEVLTAAQVRGTIVHDAIDKDLRGKFPNLSLFPQYEGYFKSYRLWKEAMNPIVVENERRYFDDDLMITGRIDLLAMMPYGSVPTLIDWKTSSAESPTWIMQAHLYAYLINKAPGLGCQDHYLFIKLDEDGCKPKVFRYLYNIDTDGFVMNAVKKFWENENSGCV